MLRIDQGTTRGGALFTTLSYSGYSGCYLLAPGWVWAIGLLIGEGEGGGRERGREGGWRGQRMSSERIAKGGGWTYARG